MSIWRTINVKDNKKVEKYHESEEAALAYWKANVAEEHFEEVLKMRGHSNAFRAQKLVDLIDEYYVKVSDPGPFVEEFKPAR